jgi:Domain of unknown function (DUF4129)
MPAQRLAHRELASINAQTWWQRAGSAISRWLNSTLGSLGPVHAGWWTLIVLIIVAVLLVFGVLFWIGPAARSRRQRTGAVLTGAPLTAEDHRRAAERLAGGQDYGAAIVERVRAIAVELESRGILTSRPGRTASELAADTAGVLPGSAAGLRDAARLFDDVRYGGRAGTLAGYQQVRDLDVAIAATRAPTVGAGADGSLTGPGRAGPSMTGPGMTGPA